MNNVPNMISKRTKDGDRVFDGMSVFEVMNRVGDVLVLRPETASDYHYYVRAISGGYKRYSDYASALNAVGLPATSDQMNTSLAATQQMLRAKAGQA